MFSFKRKKSQSKPARELIARPQAITFAPAPSPMDLTKLPNLEPAPEPDLKLALESILGTASKAGKAKSAKTSKSSKNPKISKTKKSPKNKTKATTKSHQLKSKPTAEPKPTTTSTPRPKPVNPGFNAASIQSFDELQLALKAKKIQITLGADIIAPYNIIIDYDLTLNLNGHNIISEQSLPDARVLDIRRGQVTLNGPGKVFAMGLDSVAVRVFGAMSSGMPHYTTLTVNPDVHLYALSGIGIAITPNIGAAYGAKVNFSGEIIAHTGISLADSIRGRESNQPAIHIQNGARIIADEQSGSAIDALGIGEWQIDAAHLYGYHGIRAQFGELSLQHTEIISSDSALQLDPEEPDALRLVVLDGYYVSEQGMTVAASSDFAIDLALEYGHFCGALGAIAPELAARSVLTESEFRSDVANFLSELANTAAAELTEAFEETPASAEFTIPTSSNPVVPAPSFAQAAEPLQLEELALSFQPKTPRTIPVSMDPEETFAVSVIIIPKVSYETTPALGTEEPSLGDAEELLPDSKLAPAPNLTAALQQAMPIVAAPASDSTATPSVTASTEEAQPQVSDFDESDNDEPAAALALALKAAIAAEKAADLETAHAASLEANTTNDPEPASMTDSELDTLLFEDDTESSFDTEPVSMDEPLGLFIDEQAPETRWSTGVAGIDELTPFAPQESRPARARRLRISRPKPHFFQSLAAGVQAGVSTFRRTL